MPLATDAYVDGGPTRVEKSKEAFRLPHLLFALTSAPFDKRRLRTLSFSGTLAEIMSGVQPLSSCLLKMSDGVPPAPRESLVLTWTSGSKLDWSARRRTIS
jgi:hypothetical protein